MTCGLLQEADITFKEFPKMLGSLDCMCWRWEKCPTALHGSFTGHVNKPSIVLEAVASYDLCIWHVFFFLACLGLVMILMFLTCLIYFLN